MNIVYLLIPLAVVLAALIGMAFWWAVRNGQFDDLEGPAHRILSDDDTPVPEPTRFDLRQAESRSTNITSIEARRTRA